MQPELATIFTVYALIISVVSLYYVYEHVQKLREVDWE